MLIRVGRAQARGGAKIGCFTVGAIGIRFALVVTALVRENNAGTVASHV